MTPEQQQARDEYFANLAEKIRLERERMLQAQEQQRLKEQEDANP